MTPISKKIIEQSANSKKNMMYTQQVKYSPFRTTQEAYDYCNKVLKPKKLAVILHDKDIDDKGEPVEPHFHIMMSFENERSVNNVAKLIGDKPQYIEFYTGRNAAENGFSYLIHRTKDSQSKFQYEPSEVTANFEYQDYVDGISKEVTTKNEYGSRNKINTLLDLLLVGEITKKELKAKLSGSELARYKKNIEDVHAEYLIRSAEAWISSAISNSLAVVVIWLFGAFATGKSSLSKIYAQLYVEHYGGNFFTTGSTKDMFQMYEGSRIIRVEEARAKNIPYSDLLRLLDPFNQDNVMAPSRYFDKAIAAHVWIITTPNDPLTFYKDYNLSSEIDPFGQLQRRLTKVIEMTQDEIIDMEYDESSNSYKPVSRKHNPYSAKNRPPEEKTSEALDLFNKLTGNIIEEPVEENTNSDDFKELTESEQQDLPFEL